MFCEMQAEIRTLQNDVENLRAQIKNNLITLNSYRELSKTTRERTFLRQRESQEI